MLLTNHGRHMNHPPQQAGKERGERTHCDTILFVTNYLGFRIHSNRARLLYVKLSLIMRGEPGQAAKGYNERKF
jgi:hypothetical protein